MKAAGLDYVIDGFHTDRASLDILQKLGLGVFTGGVFPADWGGHTNVNGKLETVLPIPVFERAAEKFERSRRVVRNPFPEGLRDPGCSPLNVRPDNGH